MPFVGERERLVHDVTKSQHAAGAASPQQLQRRTNLTAQAERLLVDEKDVRVEDVGRVADDGTSNLQGLFNIDMQLERRVFTVPELDAARHPDEIDPGPEVKAANDRRPREN